ncbi:MAG: copper amine oxidase N-terminal domain-containing protein [Clostridia bacterium]|nr:copper amine oxidase N-terminal domain-containing protein [Clostridia bacterium]
MEALGYSVEWNQDETLITISNDTDEIKAVIGSNVYIYNGKTIVTTSSPFLTEDWTTMLPVSALGEIAGLSVNWSTVGTKVTATVG